MTRYSCTALAGKVPLLAVFAVQCLVVAGAFIAVILTLTLQQEEDFTDTLYAQLQLRQQRTEKEILTPLVAEERSLDILAYQVALDPFARVILRDNVTSSDQIPDFFNMAQAVLNYSSRVAYIAQFQRSPNITISYNNVTQLRYTIAVSAAGGDTYMTKTPTEGLFTHPNIGQYYPLYNITTQTFGAVIPLNTMKTTWGFLDPTVTVRGKHEWSSPNVIADADGNLQLTQAYLSSIAHSPYIDTTERDSYITNGLGMVVDLTNVIPLVASSAVSPDSITCLVEMRRKSIMAGKLLFSAFDSVTSAPYTLPDSPDPILNEAFTETLQRCGDSTTCNSTVFVMGKGSDARLVSANRILTATKLDMMLIQYTNKAYFYDTFETNLIRGIIIGVCAAVVVVVSCFLIWLAIVRPLGRLQEQMGHAAVMHNQEAADAAEAEGGSMLREMNQIHCSFVAMNNKLLQARPYLPQALLVADDTDSIDADDCEDEELQNMNESSITGSSLLRDGSTSGSIRGSVYTRNSVRSSVGTNARGGGTEHALAVSTTQRRIAILVVNASGFHRSARGMSSGETAKLVSTLVTAVEGAVRNERGIVDSFHGDHFTVSFNTARLVGTALRNAAVCALQVESAVRRQTPFKRVSMGLAGGRAMVGNMGNSSMMKLCALGPASGQATLLEMIAQANLSRLGVGTEGSGCLVTESVGYDVSNHVHSEFVGWAVVLKHSYNVGTTSSPTKGDPTDCFSVLRKQVEQMNDEWMYALDDGGAGGNASGAGCLWMELQNILKEAVLVGAEHMYKDGAANSTTSTSHVTNESPKADFDRVKDSCENLASSAVSSLKSRLEMKGHGNNTEELRRESYCSSSIVHTHIASFSRNGSVATGTGSGSIGLGDSSVHSTSPPRSSGAVLRPSLVPPQVVDVGPMGQPGCATSSSTSKEERPHLRLNAAELSGEDFDRCSPKTETTGTPDISTPKDHRISVSGAPFNLNESTGAVEGQQYASLSDPRHASLRGSLSVNLARLPFHKSVLDNSSIADESRRYSSKSGGVGVFSDDVVDSPFARAYKTLTNEERFILTAYDAIVASTNHRELADVYRLSIFKR